MVPPIVVPRMLAARVPQWAKRAPLLDIVVANVFIDNKTPEAAARQLLTTSADVVIVVESTAAFMKMFDDVGVSLASGLVDVTNAGDDVTFTISAAALTLNPLVTSAGRELVVDLATTGLGSVELRDFFLITANNPVVKRTNSVMSYPEALSLRQSFGSVMSGWDEAENHDARMAALIHAHLNLSRITYAVYMAGSGEPSNFAGYGVGSDNIFSGRNRVSLVGITQEKFDALPSAFMLALKRAQMVEANVILGGDAITSKRLSGIISESIGESSMFLQSRPALKLPISQQAFDILKPYISINISIGR